MPALKFDDALADFAAWLLTARGRSRSTVESYRRDLAQFAELTKITKLAQLDSGAVLKWNDELKARGQAPSSRARKLSALRALVAWAQEYGHLSGNPIPPELTLPKGFYLPHALSEAEVRAMLDVTGGGLNSGADTPVCQAPNTQTRVSAPRLLSTYTKLISCTGSRAISRGTRPRRP